jgi:hypothetical protein
MGMRRVGGTLAPVPGYLTECIQELPEMHRYYSYLSCTMYSTLLTTHIVNTHSFFRPEMPSFVIKEYTPLLDSSNVGDCHH